MSEGYDHDILEGSDKPEEACGLFGIYGKKNDVAKLTYYGLYALQHRGQESAGITVSDGKLFHSHKGMGLVAEVFNKRILQELTGHIAIGHVRYSTTGSSLAANAQPLNFRYLKGLISLAHNGNLTNAAEVRHRLAVNGSVFQTTTDSEVMVNLIARYGQGDIEEAIMKTMIDIKGAYALLVMTENKMIGARDPHGVRPLCIGRLGDSYILTSETCALDTVGATLVREVEPGEIVVIDENGLKSIKTQKAAKEALCVFEYVYFARPDSIIRGRNVKVIRREMGRQLAREKAIEADIVMPVPDSGIAGALGYAEESGISYAEGLMKNRYIGRTFIQPTQELREIAVRLKLNVIKDIVKGKRVIMVDDSIVRGTTSKKIVDMVRKAGAKEIHMLITSPPLNYPCFYGIDTSERKQLIAANNTVEEIGKYIGVDSLYYLSKDGMLKSTGLDVESFCTSCFTGEYPIDVVDYQVDQNMEGNAHGNHL